MFVVMYSGTYFKVEQAVDIQVRNYKLYINIFGTIVYATERRCYLQVPRTQRYPYEGHHRRAMVGIPTHMSYIMLILL